MSNYETPSVKFIRLGTVLSKTGLSRSTIYAYVQTSRFPAPVNLTARSVAWIEAEIDEWIAARIAARR